MTRKRGEPKSIQSEIPSRFGKVSKFLLVVHGLLSAVSLVIVGLRIMRFHTNSLTELGVEFCLARKLLFRLIAMNRAAAA